MKAFYKLSILKLAIVIFEKRTLFIKAKSSVVALMFMLLKTASLDKWERIFNKEPNTANLLKLDSLLYLSNFLGKKN